MTIVVFGGTGLIGKAICEAFDCDEMAHLGPCVALGSNYDLSSGGSGVAIQDHHPHVIINASWPFIGEHVECFSALMRDAIGWWQYNHIQGCLINLASIYATLPPRFEIYPDGMGKDPAYVAAKAAIVQLTRYYARKVRGSGIRVNSVSPGGVYRDEPIQFQEAYSRQTNHGRMLPAKAVAQACKFLIDCAWVTGVDLTVDDGFSL